MEMVKSYEKEQLETTMMGLSAPGGEVLPTSALPESRPQNAKTRWLSPR
jgi:hypothetical protein